jgi:hypothetical protein
MTGSVKSGYSAASSSAYSGRCGPKPKDALSKVWKFGRRLVYVKQMDFQYALWQAHKLLINPHQLYKNFQYRKTTKGQFARDDPAFLVLLASTFAITTLLFGLMVKFPLLDMLYLLLWFVCVDCIAFGVSTATVFWFICNKYFLSHPRSTGNDVEWGFCFDVHLNSFYPFFFILHGLQLPFLWFITSDNSYFSVLIGNLFWVVACGYYWYITFLGYNIQPHLQKSSVYLGPLVLVSILYLISLPLKLNWTIWMVNFYEYRIGHIPDPQ